MLVFVINPSRRARAGSLRHAETILRAAPHGDLRVVALFEQVTADDGPPFDRVLLESRTPPEPPAAEVAATCSGTSWQRATCRDTASRASANASMRFRAAHAAWVKHGVGQLRALRTQPAEESSKWNIRAALLRAGQTAQAAGTPRRCVVLLGGLAVRYPPARLPRHVLGGVHILAPGWQGTTRVQRSWKRSLAAVGASIAFLPETLTELELNRMTARCLMLRHEAVSNG
jgi:hypothetical protein